MRDILQLHESRSINLNNLPKPPRSNDNDGDGGEPPMAKDVTHEELELSNQNVIVKVFLNFWVNTISINDSILALFNLTHYKYMTCNILNTILNY